MKYLIIILIGLSTFSCNMNDSKKTVKSEDISNSTTYFYFGTFKRTLSSYISFDTFQFSKRIFNDTLLMFSYGEDGANSIHLLDGIQFKFKNNKIIGIEKQYLKNTLVDTIYVVDQTGDSTLLLECQPKNPNIDGDGIHVISIDYGLILGYSRSWSQYYHIINTSNKISSKKIFQLQRLYFMKKSKI